MKKSTCLTGAALVALIAAVLIAGNRRPAETKMEKTATETTQMEETEEMKQTNTEITETIPPLPDSVLFYGEILEVRKDEEGHPEFLLMESPKDGKWGMDLSDETVCIDSGERCAFDPAVLKEGDRIYVFRSPMTARTLPPKSPALALVRNIPMDASCPMYHEAEKLSLEDGILKITTDRGEKTLGADENTVVLSYEGAEKAISDLKEGDHFMAWYWDRGETVLHPSHLMLLPTEN